MNETLDNKNIKIYHLWFEYLKENIYYFSFCQWLRMVGRDTKAEKREKECLKKLLTHVISVILKLLAWKTVRILLLISFFSFYFPALTLCTLDSSIVSQHWRPPSSNKFGEPLLPLHLIEESCIVGGNRCSQKVEDGKSKVDNPCSFYSCPLI